MLIEMRPATINDSDTLLEWRNDPQTLEFSKVTTPVSPEEHARWMKFNVLIGYPEHMVIMAQCDLGIVGVVRFDAVKSDLMSYRVSITVAPKHRGKGFAEDILGNACEIMRDFDLIAEIKYKNEASIRTFEACGFTPVGDDGTFLTYRRLQ